MTTLAGSITATPIDVSPALAMRAKSSEIICAVDCTYCFLLAEQLSQNGKNPMKSIAATDAKRAIYLPCPCGNGKKFRFCHGNRRPCWTFNHLLHPSE